MSITSKAAADVAIVGAGPAGLTAAYLLTKAGYSASEELPILLLLFGVPAAVALLLKWKVL